MSGGCHQRCLALEPVEQVAGLLPPGELGGERGGHRVTDADHTQEVAHVVGQPGEDLPDEVVGHRAVIAGELGEERVGVGGLRDAKGGQPQPGGPSAGALVQHLDLCRREVHPGLGQQLRRLRQGEAQLPGAQLPQSPSEAQPGQRQWRIQPAGENELDGGGLDPGEDLQSVHAIRVDQFVQVVEDQADGLGQGVQRFGELGDELGLAAGLPVPRGV